MRLRSKVPGYRSSDLNGESKVLTPGAKCPVTGLRTLTVRARCSPREQDLNGESKVLTPGSRCPVTGLRTINGESKVLTPGARCPVTGLRTINGERKVLTTGAREKKKPFLLIDFSEYLRINVYVLGAVFLQLCKLLSLEERPIVQKPVDPSLFIHRFTDHLSKIIDVKQRKMIIQVLPREIEWKHISSGFATVATKGAAGGWPGSNAISISQQAELAKKALHENVDWAYKIDPLRCISLHGVTERYISGQKSDTAGFVRILLDDLESRISVLFCRFASFGGSTPGSVSPPSDGLALGAATVSAVGLAVTAISADGPAETSTTGTGRVRPSGTEENGVGPGSGTSSGRTARILERSASSIATSRAVLTSFCIAFRPLLKAQVPNSYIRSSPTGVREMAARTASPLALELLDPLIPLGEGLLEGRHFSAVDFVPIFRPGKEIGDRAMRSPTRAVDHPLVFSGGGAAVQILDSRAAGGSSPCFISTSITGVVDPDPSRRESFAGVTSSTSVSFSFPRLAARASS
nr:hypothetical protein M569_03986 [Ipomoea trifida]